MASISKDATGNRTIQFVGGDNKRRSLRLGKVNLKQAEAVRNRVESLNAAAIARIPWDADLAAWVNGIGDDLAKKLAAVLLIPPRQSRTLKQFLTTYVSGRANDGATKPATLITIRRVADDLTALFRPNTDMRAVTAERAEEFKAFYQDKGLAPATTYRRLKMAKMLFGHALRMKLIAENPFADVRGKNVNPADRQYYLDLDDAKQLLDAANPTWRTIIALARLAGLRTPSETLSLRWEHVDFANNRMTVPEPKNERHEGREYRVMPIFHGLRPYLEDAHELAEPGELYVVGGRTGEVYRQAAQGEGGWQNANLRTTFLKIIRRAGLEPWPRLFQNLRASFETDLMQEHPIHVVTAWVGNTPKIALAHYLQTLESDFEKAVQGGAYSGAVVVQKAVQTPADTSGQELTELAFSAGKEGELSARVQSCQPVYKISCGQGGT